MRRRRRQSGRTPFAGAGQWDVADGSPSGRRRLLSMVMIALWPTVSWGAGEPDAFALSGLGARPAAMGGAFTGLADDVEAVYYNPAGLGWVKESAITAMVQPAALDTSRSFLALDKTWRHDRFPGGVGLGWVHLGSKNIEITNAEEKVLGTDNLSNDLLLLSSGVRAFEHVSLGGAVKYFRFAFHGFSESGFGYDLSVQAQYEYVRFGLDWTDLSGTVLSGKSITWAQTDVTDKVPSRFRPGVAFLWPQPYGLPIHLKYATDALMNLEGSQDLRFFTGGEVLGWDDRAAFRMGFQEGTGPTFGAGARLKCLQVDYSYLLSLHLRDEHRISTTFHF